MYFGVPAQPMPASLSDAIGRAVAQVPGIVEAYLPQCYIQGDEAARQVLVIGVAAADRIPAVMQDLLGRLECLMPPDQFVDVFPFQAADLPQEARVAACRIVGASTAPERRKPWWRFW